MRIISPRRPRRPKHVQLLRSYGLAADSGLILELRIWGGGGAWGGGWHSVMAPEAGISLPLCPSTSWRTPPSPASLSKKSSGQGNTAVSSFRGLRFGLGCVGFSAKLRRKPLPQFMSFKLFGKTVLMVNIKFGLFLGHPLSK